MRTAELVLAGLLLTATSALKPPSYLKTCSRNDPNFDECALRSGIDVLPYFIRGDPKYKLAPLSPMIIPEISIVNLDKGSSATGMDITFRNMTIIGLEGSQVKKTHYDFKNQKEEIVLQIPQLQLYFQYEIDGKILLLPIKGKGDGSINITDVDAVYRMDYDLVTKKDGLQYMKTRNSSLEHTAKLITSHLSNLFNGDKILGDTTNAFLNENWRVMDEDVAPHIALAIGEAVTQILAPCMDLIPYDYLFPESA